jgi:hypothetical protein
MMMRQPLVGICGKASRARQRAGTGSEDARVDDILARLHDTGLSQLSRGNRILQRASERYKQRLQLGNGG